jgi:hypothetical protein
MPEATHTFPGFTVKIASPDAARIAEWLDDIMADQYVAWLRSRGWTVTPPGAAMEARI